MVGLPGPNGAGKATLLGMLTGLIHPGAGAVDVFGHRVGIALESPALLPHLTGRQLLAQTWAITGRQPADPRFDTVRT